MLVQGDQAFVSQPPAPAGVTRTAVRSPPEAWRLGARRLVVWLSLLGLSLGGLSGCRWIANYPWASPPEGGFLPRDVGHVTDGDGDTRIADGTMDSADARGEHDAPMQDAPKHDVYVLDTRSLDQKMPPDQKIPLDQKLPPDLPPIPGAWVHVKAGTFGMGEVSGDVCYAWQTRHQVTLTHGFEIQATETTQKQFREVMGYNLSAHMSCGGACPVERLSWHEAAAYCNALSAKVGLTPCYACTGSQQNVSCTTKTAAKGKAFYACPGYRLPTEAEWEVAYRAGTTGNYYLPGVLNANCGTGSMCRSDPVADTLAWYCGNSKNTMHPVGQKKFNAWGIYDMAGNASEWCQDAWNNKALGSTAVMDPVVTGTVASDRVLRPGSYGSLLRYNAAAYRWGTASTNRYGDSGVRCVRTVLFP